ncbi:uncharacterized protein B0T15DRAFT_537564 [Chaetomium strumarium]|uniref:Uncharacterized protein n=1 Tax=Chaetomium strumarium TaxID=1170767 RepID=A0AAJ0GRF2_9PEZI|nr:hypothetical protein B0T15DRAFT_537564 [Chaetomium strumarium]
MKALIPVQRLRLGHILVGLPCLLPAFPLHKHFHAAVIQLPVAADFLCLPLFLPLPSSVLSGVNGPELGVIPRPNSAGGTPREMLGDRESRQPLPEVEVDFRVGR